MTQLGNKFAGEITLRGKITLAILLGKMLCGERGTLLRLVITPLGIPLMCYVEGIDELHWG